MESLSIRNFVIIAHIDHGKSTLADRFLELTGAVERRKMREQYLDMHPLERERGITIKMQPVRMLWHPDRAQVEDIILNLIDTPGHADFSYEVSRALAAVEGAILLVDATQGIQAQTLAVVHAAREEGLVIIPVINKIDLRSADIRKTEDELCATLGVAESDVLKISAKTGAGAEALLAAIVEKIPSPEAKISKYGNTEMTSARSGAPLRALVFDSKYDPYLGVVAHVRIVDGALAQGERVSFLASGASCESREVGVFGPGRISTGLLREGEIGYVATGIKEPALVRVGDTITRADIRGLHRDQRGKSSVILPLPGYRETTPMVWASLFPEDQDLYDALREALSRLKLEDAALAFFPEDAGALGRGFRAGFLGMLHMEIAVERLRREYGLTLALTRPSVALLCRSKLGTETMVYAASRLPEAHEILEIAEPWARAEIVTPGRFLGAIAGLVASSGGAITGTDTLSEDRLRLTAEAPLREIIVDFYDRIKSVSQGFASFSYTPAGYRAGDLVRLDILIADERQPALAEAVARDRAYAIGRRRLEALRDIVPRQLFAVALQASVAGRIIARETIPAMKKDVTGYLYGGDRTRKMKLWKKQQKGKKRLKEIGRVTIPPEIFFKLHRRYGM